MKKCYVILFIGLIMMAKFNLNAQNITKYDVATLIEKAKDKFKIPAIAITIMDSDSIVINEVLGTRVVGKDNPVSKNDYFHIGSCSKSVLSIMAGKLVEERNIKWETKFFDIYPELKTESNKEYAGITLEDLFLCKAGIKPYTSGVEKFPDINSTVQDKRYEFVKYLLQLPPASKQKSNGKFKFLYSNASYTMASAMLEKVSGKTYEELVRQTFTALDIEVHIGWPNSIEDNQPWGHIISKGKIDSFPPDHEYKVPYLLTPAGDLSLKPADYAKYILIHLQGLTGKDNYLTSNSFQFLNFGHKGFSIGIANGKRGGYSYSGADGSAGTFFCRFIIIPNSDFAFTIMMNAGSGTGQMKAINWLSNKIIKKNYYWWWKFWM